MTHTTTTAFSVDVNPDALIATMRRLAAEHPDRTAECQYTRREDEFDDSTPLVAPVCIVGVALHELGVGLETLNFYEGSNVNQLIQADVESKNGWLFWVQNQQDLGDTWAEAVASADDYYPEV